MRMFFCLSQHENNQFLLFVGGVHYIERCFYGVDKILKTPLKIMQSNSRLLQTTTSILNTSLDYRLFKSVDQKWTL